MKKGQSVPTTGTCLSKALSPALVSLILQMSTVSLLHRDSVSSALQEAQTMVSGSLLKGQLRSWPNSVASKGVLFPQACPLLSGLCPVYARLCKAPHLLPTTLKWLHCPDLSPGSLPQCPSLPNSRWLCSVHRHSDLARGGGASGLPHTGC